MAEEDLSQLRIDKTRPAFRAARGKRRTVYIVAAAAVILLAVLALTGVFSPAVRVDAVSVQQFYPSQSFTLLNASGYVVPSARRRSPRRSTARLEELFVERGAR